MNWVKNIFFSLFKMYRLNQFNVIVNNSYKFFSATFIDCIETWTSNLAKKREKCSESFKSEVFNLHNFDEA